jgi:diguanylate cyclase (GGDEF)-like protein/PAS domain S-box-containing protein
VAVARAPTESELRYRRFVEAMPVGVLITQRGDIKFANPKASELSGYAIEELVGRPFMPLIHEDDQARVLEMHQRRMAGQVEVSAYESRIWRKDGALRHLRLRVQTLDWEGSPSGLSILTDITEQVEAEARLRELSSIVEQTSDAIMLTATDGRIKYVNPGFERMTGYRRDEVIGQTPATFKSGMHEPAFYRELWDTIGAGRPFHAHVVNRRKDGTLYHAVKTITPMFDDLGRIVSYVNIDMDFTAQHEAQERTAHLALHDSLTGLPNRAKLTDRLGQAIAHHAREGAAFSLLYIDLDGFKAINDRLGHRGGDEVLKEVARRLNARARSVDTVARMGGDEFVVLLAAVAEPAVAARIASELDAALREPIMLAAGPCQVGASIGISVFPRDGLSIDAMLQSADHAMYRAKHRARAPAAARRLSGFGSGPGWACKGAQARRKAQRYP